MDNNVDNITHKIESKYPPNALEYIQTIFTDFIEFSGDRVYGDDKSIICGVASLDKTTVSIIGQLRGGNTSENIYYNFSMGYPEGYRKATRIMKQAEKFNRPVICFIDTIGAYPGIQAEERGQANAIANCMSEMMLLEVPVISILIGNGYSGGALALCAANEIIALENTVLGVISPKACASILWKDSSRAVEAAELSKMTSFELYENGIVDKIVMEPNDGTHINLNVMSDEIKTYLIKRLKVLKKNSKRKIVSTRQKKYRNMREQQ